MKQAIVTIHFLFIILQCLNAQIKNLHEVANIIPDSLVKQKIVGNGEVKFVEEKYLKEGWNEFSHKPGGYVYVSLREGKVSGFYISNISGHILGGGFLPIDGQNTKSEMFSTCLCRGEKECGEIFIANRERYNAVCAGNACFFTRPFDASAHKRDYLQKIKDDAKAVGCDVNKTASLNFSKNVVFLSKKSMHRLDSLYSIISKTQCRIEVIAYDVNCEVCQQVSWDRTYSVFKYLRKKGIDSLRFILRYEEGTNPQEVIIRQTTDWDYPTLPEPPLPCYSYHRLTKRRCKGEH
ncbi:MAG TPA: hypothetical protein PK275_12130 [Chitinophagaceae bacterium]|nr:hypothetical protein [Chitinophagaceae bacterium]